MPPSASAASTQTAAVVAIACQHNHTGSRDRPIHDRGPPRVRADRKLIASIVSTVTGAVDEGHAASTEALKPAMSVPEADARLTGPGGFFEIVTQNVGGIEVDTVATPHQNLRDLLAASAGHGGDGSARCYVFDDGRCATFAENIGHAAAVAAALTDRFDVRPGDRVGLLGANCPEWIQAFWATVSAGAVAVAMNGWWKDDEIRYAMELTAPKVLIADRRRLQRLERDPGVPVIVMDTEPAADTTAADTGATNTTAATGTDAGTGVVGAATSFKGLLERYDGASLPDNDLAMDDPAAILFTSGTTGRPRGAIQTHRNFLAYVSCAFMIGARQFLRFPGQAADAAGPTLACSPLFHVSGLHACAVTAVAAGVDHVWTTGRYDAEKILRLTEEHRITRWSGVTTQVWRLVEHPRLGEYDTTSVKAIGGGGSVWSPELQRICREALPHARISLSIGYGLTESSGLASSAADDVLAEHPDSVGYPLPTARVRIADDEGVPLGDGAVGNVCISGPMVTPGYWNDAAATADAIGDGWLRTGDYGYMRDGLLFLVSRRSDLIIRGGENIYPAEIEQRLDSHPAVRESAVFAVGHRELGQEVKAVVVLHEAADGSAVGVDVGALRLWVAGALADIKVPAHWELRREPLPRNATGKILKRVLQGETEYDFVEE